MRSEGEKKKGGLWLIMAMSFVLIMLIGSVLFLLLDKPRYAWVETGKIYGDFDMKKELESKYSNVEQMRKTMLDSLEIQLNYLSKKIQMMGEKQKEERDKHIQEFELKRQDYLLKQKNFSENNEAAAKQYDEQIWKQLNEYIREYGKENNYDYIFGADGTGAVMYAKGANDVTEEVKKYVNVRYKGGKP